MSLLTIDLNADLGESRERLADGSDAELLRYITSASVACGGHAGDALTMEETLQLVSQNHVAVGAHPSYPDLAGFGRTALKIPIAELESSIADQISQLLSIARRIKVPIVHVKPHGALYHACNDDAGIARALGRAVLAVDRGMILIALLDSPESASAQAVSLVTRGTVLSTSGSALVISADTLCIHSDTPGCAAIARAVKERLAGSNVSLRALRVV